MRIVGLIGGGRSGIDFFQSLLDEHDEILQFPHHFHFGDFYQKVNKIKDEDEILSIFIKDNKRCFDSRLNQIERHDKLGENKNEFYQVDENLFKSHFKKLSQNKDLDIFKILFNLHAAYYLANNKGIGNKKIIVLHLHHIEKLKFLNQLNIEVIYTIREPFSSISSYINHWMKIKSIYEITPYSYFYYLNRIFNGLKKLSQMGIKTHVIKLESLHKKNVNVMKEFCFILNIKYSNVLTQSTFMGKKWWGDQFSLKFLNGVNKNFQIKYDENLFYKKDIRVLEFFLQDYMKHYGYAFHTNKKINMLEKFLPLKTEIIIWKKFFHKFNFLQLFYALVYWLKRISIMRKNNFKDFIMPHSLGEESNYEK